MSNSAGQERQIEITLPTLHPAQWRVLSKLRRFNTIACGRRWGKTRFSAAWALEKIGRGLPGFWVAPSFPIADIGWRLMRGLAVQIPGCEISDGKMRISFNGGWGQFKSADSEGGLRGEGLGWLVADECAHIRNWPDVWEQELRPALTDLKGEALFPSTPFGLNHYAEMFRRAESDPAWASFQEPTRNNPFIDPGEIEAARKDMPELVFRQEYLAEFVQLAGAICKREWFGAITNWPKLKAARGWDLAASTKDTANRSAGVKLSGPNDDGDYCVLDCVAGRWAWPQLVRLIRDTALADGPEVVQVVETAGTQRGLYDILLAEPSLAGIEIRPITPATDKLTRANPWLARAEQKKLHLMQGAWNNDWLSEVCAYSGDRDDQDDIWDATSIAYHALSEVDPWLGLEKITSEKW